MSVMWNNAKLVFDNRCTTCCRPLYLMLAESSLDEKIYIYEECKQCGFKRRISGPYRTQKSAKETIGRIWNLPRA